MPKHFRKCNFCTNDSTSNPTIVIFSASDNLKNVLNVSQESDCFICEEHFQPSDLKPHGVTKRLRDGAHPEFFPRQDAVLLDHAYVQTGPLELDSEECSDEPDVVLRQQETLTIGDLQEGDDNVSNIEVNTESPSTSQGSSVLPSSGSVYVPSQASAADSDIIEEPDSQPETEGVNLDGSMLIVPWACIIILLSKCQRHGCSEQVLPSNMEVSRKGAAVNVKLKCNSGHDETWASSPSVGSGRWTMPYVNVLLILYTFLTGLHFDQLKAFCDGCNILFISSSTYYRYLKKLVYPVVWCYWLMDQAKNLAEIMKTGAGVVLSGDARFDSPGFSAKFCTYFVQEVVTKKIVALEVGMKGQVSCSSQMEGDACERLLNFLVSAGMKVRVFASDRSTTIRTMMAKKFPSISHQFDIWHFVKGINKRLFKSFKLVKCPNLKKWQKSVTNMIWWAIRTSKKCSALAKEKILSIFQHTSNVHVFPAFTLFKKCEHPEIDEARPWIKAGSFEMNKLRLAVMGKNGKNLDDLKFMDEFVHTSDLESLNCLILKYCNKTYVYSWLGMLVRSCLAALDFNHNTQRKAKLSADGKPMYKMKVDRTGTKVTVVEQKVKKDYSFQTNILELCVQCLEKGVVPNPVYPIDETLNKKRRHSFVKDDLVKNFASRLKKYKPDS